MNILAIDATSEELIVALEAKGKIYRLRQKVKREHDELLIPALLRLFKKSGMCWENLHAIAVASGPGRFTGIRIGLSFALVAGFKLNIPILAINRLEAIANRSKQKEVVAAIEGWKGEVYYQRFKNYKDTSKAQWVSAEEWQETRKKIAAGGCDIIFDNTDGSDLIAAAKRRLQKKNIPEFKPFYLKRAGYEKSRS